jgi:hypothetical protein
MVYAMARAVWGLMNKQRPTIDNINDKHVYVATMSDWHDSYHSDNNKLLEVSKVYLAFMQDVVGEAIYRWQEVKGICLSRYKLLIGQPLPAPVFECGKLHYDTEGVLFHPIHDKYGAVHIRSEA